MSTHEIAAAYAWLTATLSADTTLLSYATGGVYRAYAPPSTPTPFVIFGFVSGTDSLTMNAYRIISEPLFQIKVSGPAANMAAIVNAATELDNVLKRTSGTASGGAILACYRESPLAVDSIINGELWSDMGGMYRLQVQQM